MTWIFLLHLATSLYMTGIIWMVQIVHYPLMGKVGENQFIAYERSHTMLMGYTVGPQMILELGTGILLALQIENFKTYWWANLALIAIIWASTFFIQVPLHETLSNGFSEKAHLKLVNSNWIRTIAWTAKAILLLFLLKEMLGNISS